MTILKRILRSKQSSLISYLSYKIYSHYLYKIPYELIINIFKLSTNGFIYYFNSNPIIISTWRVDEHISIIDLKLSYKYLDIFFICYLYDDYTYISTVLNDIVYYCKRKHIKYINIETPTDNIVKNNYITYGFKEYTDIAGNYILSLDIDILNIADYIKPIIKLCNKKLNRKRYKKENMKGT